MSLPFFLPINFSLSMRCFPEWICSPLRVCPCTAISKMFRCIFLTFLRACSSSWGRTRSTLLGRGTVPSSSPPPSAAPSPGSSPSPQPPLPPAKSLPTPTQPTLTPHRSCPERALVFAAWSEPSLRALAAALPLAGRGLASLPPSACNAAGWRAGGRGRGKSACAASLEKH